MNPLRVRAVSSGYKPGYATFHEIEDWHSFVNSSNRSLFSPSTLVFAGLLGTSFFSAADAQEQSFETGKPLKSSNEAAAAAANAALDEVKSSGHWYENSALRAVESPGAGPKITTPEIRISFGNSYTGIFDTIRAKKATLKIFESYGLKVQSEYPLKRDGLEFTVDGYDPEKKIGFEIVGADNYPGSPFVEEKKKKSIPPSEALDEVEAKKLYQIVKDGEANLFLPPAQAYPNMDGDEYTPLRAYLQSVLDYLDWLKKQGRL